MPRTPSTLFISCPLAGYFVTKLSDSYAEKLFAGLLSVGDEVRELNGAPASKLSPADIHHLITSSRKLTLKVKSNSSLTVTSEQWF